MKQVAAALRIMREGPKSTKLETFYLDEGQTTDRREFWKSVIQMWLVDVDEAESFGTESGVEFARAHIRSAATKRELKKASKHLGIARKSLEKLPPRVRRSFSDLDRLIRRAQLWASAGRGQPTHTGFKQRVAVTGGADLCYKSGHRIAATRNGPWHHLAAILYGDKSAIAGREPGIDFFNLMREYEQEGTLFPLREPGRKS